VRILKHINLILACGLLTACPDNNMKGSVQNSLAGHSRADYMTGQVMQGDFSGAINSGVTPPSYDCNPEPVEETVIRRPAPQTPRYPAPIQDLVNQFPPNCGYKYRNVARTVIDNNCESLSKIVDGAPISEAGLCESSQCQIATMFALAYKLRGTPRWNEIKDDFRCPKSGFPQYGKAYNIFNGYDNVLTLSEEYGLGNATRTRTNRLDEHHRETGKPEAGDLMLFQRNESQEGTAHSGFFSHYIKDNNGNISDVCYWSSFGSKNGFGVKCEPKSVLSFIDSVTIEGI
jgi:hypothetical protein